MKRMILVLGLAGSIGVPACSSSNDNGKQVPAATETNVTPAPCDNDGGCPADARCLHLHDDQTGKDGPGFCEVNDKTSTATSTGTPAPCHRNTDCGPQGACVHIHGGDGGETLAFCRTDNLVCPRLCQTSNEAAATVCRSDADCSGALCAPSTACAF